VWVSVQVCMWVRVSVSVSVCSAVLLAYVK